MFSSYYSIVLAEFTEIYSIIIDYFYFLYYYLSMEHTACFTGHRPKGLPWFYDENKPNCLAFKKFLLSTLRGAINYGLRTFLTGMAEGFDMITAESIIELKNEFPYIKLIAVIPCIGQELKWSTSQQKRYHKILQKCDDKIILSKSYTPNCMIDRNKYMVDHSSFVIACYNGKHGGTEKTIRYAQQTNKKVKIINPEKYH